MEDKEKDLDNLEKLGEKEEKVTTHDMCSAEEEKVNEESEKKTHSGGGDRGSLGGKASSHAASLSGSATAACGACRSPSATGATGRFSAAFRASPCAAMSRAGEGADAADTSCVVGARYCDVLPDTRYCGDCI